MTEDEKQARLKLIGEAIRLSELSDVDLIEWIVMDIFRGIYDGRIPGTTPQQMAEMLSFALCTLGDFHRANACKW